MKERIKLKKLKKILVAFMAVFVFLTGCGGVRGDRFSSEESAKELLLSEMEKRYGMSFIIAGNEKYHDFGGLYGYTYSCNVAPENMPDRTSYAAVFQRAGSGLQDDYVSYFIRTRRRRLYEKFLMP